MLICEKGTDHANFVKIGNLTVEHIPEASNRGEILIVVQKISDLTVKIRTGRVRNLTGGANEKITTGFVTELQFAVGSEGTSCRCRTCKLSGQDNKVVGKILIATSTTVISSDEKAKRSEFEVTIDGGSTYILSGIRLVDQTLGFCVVECETCSMEVIDYLNIKREQCEQLMSKVRDNGQRLCIIVSHPHGLSKRVSLGQWTRRIEQGAHKLKTYCKYEYDTPTCPGSAGAFVYIPGISDIAHRPNHHHWGVNGKGINYSSVGVETPAKN